MWSKKLPADTARGRVLQVLQQFPLSALDFYAAQANQNKNCRVIAQSVLSPSS